MVEHLYKFRMEKLGTVGDYSAQDFPKKAIYLVPLASLH